MKRTILVLCFLPFFLLGQSVLKLDSVKYKQLGGYYVNTGFGFWNPQTLTTDQFSQLFPSFDKDAYKDQKSTFGYSNGSLIEGPFYISAGATLYNIFTEKIKRKKNLQTNIELFYYRAPEAAISFGKATWKRIDTLTSSSPSVQPYYRDSVNVKSTAFTYLSDYIGYGMSETFGTDFNRFISVYAGPGLNFRYSVNPRIIETETSYPYQYVTQNPNKNYDSLIVGYGPSSKQTIIYKASSSYAFSLYVTGGINARIFRVKKSQLLFNANFRLGGEWIHFKRLDQTFSSGIATMNFGLRYVFL